MAYQACMKYECVLEYRRVNSEIKILSFFLGTIKFECYRPSTLQEDVISS
jgi:hypothetical protein